MGKMVEAIQAAAPAADVVILPPLMASLDRQGWVEAGTTIPLVRVEIGLAVAAGALQPDISTPDKFRGALRGAHAVT